MKQDVKQLKSRYGSVNLDQYETAVIDALVDYTGMEKGTLLRGLLMKASLDMLGVSSLAEFDCIMGSIASSQHVGQLH